MVCDESIGASYLVRRNRFYSTQELASMPKNGVVSVCLVAADRSDDGLVCLVPQLLLTKQQFVLPSQHSKP